MKVFRTIFCISVRLYFYLAIVFQISVCFSQAQTSGSSAVNGFIGTEITNGFQVIVLNQTRSPFAMVDEELNYGVVNTNGAISIWVPRDADYAYEVELIDSQRANVPKTELGKKAGTRFSALSGLPSSKEIHLIQSAAQKQGEGLAIFPLFKTRDIFEINKPGDYVLRISFQFLVHVKSGTNDTFHVVRLHPLDYPIRLVNDKTKAETGYQATSP